LELKNFESVLRNKKPVIAMVHLGALPGTPLYEEDEGLEGIVKKCT
jgi:predicted TIM-barrel enzyme